MCKHRSHKIVPSRYLIPFSHNFECIYILSRMIIVDFLRKRRQVKQEHRYLLVFAAFP